MSCAGACAGDGSVAEGAIVVVAVVMLLGGVYLMVEDLVVFSINDCLNWWWLGLKMASCSCILR